MKTAELFSEQELQSIADQTAVRLLQRKAHDFSGFSKYLTNILDTILHDHHAEIVTRVCLELAAKGQPLLANEINAYWAKYHYSMLQAQNLLLDKHPNS